MNDGLRTERSALPLAEAAVRLGMSAEALRRRVERGEARGFEHNGEYFVYVSEPGAGRRFGGGAMDPAATGAQAGAKAGTQAGTQAGVQAGTGEPTIDGALPVVVEFQKMELTRLLRENDRLNARLDQLMDEIRHLRDMQQREQVLRQQDQGLRRQIQDTLDHLAHRLALPPPRPALADDAVLPPAPAAKPDPAVPGDPRPELVLTRTVSAKKTPSERRASPDKGPGSGAAYLATGRNGQWRREPHAVMPKGAPERPAPPNPATPNPAMPNSSAPPAPVGNGGIAPEEAAELAGILKDIGQSLRDSEAFRRFPPIKPVPAPQRAGERRPAAGPPPTVRESVATDDLPAEEEAMLAILDSMGPTIEDRRSAARRMRRLLRSRMPPRRHEP